MSTMTSDEKIGRILAMIHDPQFVEFELAQEAPSIFKAVGRTHTETWHSAFLGWLLDPEGSHQLGLFPLTRLVLLLALKDTLSNGERGIDFRELLTRADFSKVKVRPNERELVEVTVGNMRFDIFVDGIIFEPFKELQIVVEVKVNAPIDPVQCARYILYMTEKSRDGVFSVPVFVAPTSKLLGTPSEIFGNSSWLGVDFQSIYDEVVEPCLQHPKISGFGQTVLSEYIKTLKYRQEGKEPLATTQKERELVNVLFEKHGSAIRALYEILSQSSEEFESGSLTASSARGSIKIKIGDTTFDENSVTKLYRQIMKFLYDGGYLDKLELPLATGTKRYLLAKEPMHQRGNPFVNPVEYKGYYMEANKSRDSAIQDLIFLLEKCDLSLQVIH